MIWALLLAVELMTFAASAQPVSTSVHKFEVASIKPCQKSASRNGSGESPDRLNLSCLTTAGLIRLAYLVFPTGQPNAPVSPTVFQMPISGGPSWIESDRYTINAKAEKSVNIEMRKGPMLQRLLQDRFSVKLHWEAKDIHVFELTAAKDGPKLQPARKGECVVYDRNNPSPEHAPGQPAPVLCGSVRKSASGGFDVSGATIPELCRQLSAYVDRDIIDKTGITGTFDVHLDLAPADLGDAGAAPDPSSPFIPGDGGAITVALKKLGLQMHSAKESGQFLVIDHVERPSEN